MNGADAPESEPERAAIRLARPRRLTRPLGPGSKWLVLILSCQVVGCRCDEDHPYTPFSVTDTLPSESPPPSQGATAEPKGSEETSWQAPPGAREWAVLGKKLVAPQGLSFGTLVRYPKVDLVWLGPEQPRGPIEGAGIYRVAPAGELELALPLPTFLPRGPDCTLAARLERAGQSTLGVELTAQCQTPRLPGIPERAILLLDVSGSSPPFGVRIEPPAPGESLTVKADASDSDGDGQDDRNLEFRLKSPGGGEGSLTISWLSRTAGPSLRTETPAKGLAERAQVLARKAIRKKERAEVPPEVDALRRAFGAVCREGKRARVSLLDETRLVCENTGRALVQLQMANVEAFLGLGRPLSAVGELLRAGYFGPEPSERERDAMASAIFRKLPRRSATEIATLPGPYPRDAWLSFDNASRLWLHTGAVDRVIWPLTSPSAEPAPADGGEVPHPVEPDPRVGPGGRRLIAALPSCDRSEITLMFQAGSETLPPVTTALLAPRPGNCDHFGRGPLVARVLEFTGGEAVVLVEGEPVSTLGGPTQLRATHSWHTPLGLVVADTETVELWGTGQKWLGQECAIAAQGRTIACLKEAAVVVFTRADQSPAAGGTP